MARFMQAKIVNYSAWLPKFVGCIRSISKVLDESDAIFTETDFQIRKNIWIRYLNIL